MAPSKAQIDQETRDKVNSTYQTVEEVLKPGMADIQAQMRKLSVVSKNEFAEYVNKTEVRLVALKLQQDKTEDDLAPILKAWSVFTGTLTKVLVGALLLGLILILFSQIDNLGVKLG